MFWVCYETTKSRSKPTEAKSTDKFKIDGGGGNDEIEAGSNDDSLHGASGNDTITVLTYIKL